MSAWSRMPALVLCISLLACQDEEEVDGLVYGIKSGSRFGTITSAPSGILVEDTGGHTAEAFPTGSTVTLTASTNGQSTFAGWTGEGCSGTGTCQVVSKGPGFYQYVLATFRSTAAPAPPFELHFESPPREVDVIGGAGTVTVEVAGADAVTCSRSPGELLLCNGQPWLSFNTPVTARLTAVAAAGSVFTGWLAFGCGAEPVCEVEVAEHRTEVYAFFEPA